MHDFLIAGGFELKRRCYELQAHAADLTVSLLNTVPLTKVTDGTVEYDRCCKLLYDYYSETHYAISPLTVDADTFCADLPSTVLCHISEGKIVHFAFVEADENGYEIAYVGTTRQPDFKLFAKSLAAVLFRECDYITAECDDADPAAMELKSLFNLPSGMTYNTYVLD